MVFNRLRGRFAFDDVAQQFVGALILGGPFTVTEEVWSLGSDLTVINLVAISLLLLLLGYAILYKADTTRDPDREGKIAGIPLRYLSLLLVSVLSPVILAVTIGAPTTFVESNSLTVLVLTTFQASLVIAPFSMIGSATADSFF